MNAVDCIPARRVSTSVKRPVLRPLLLGTLVFLAAHPALPQTNFWYWEHSAPWESPYWSLGTLPASSQTVAIPNPGWKAVAISGSTVANFPDSLTISNLHVSAPDESFSTLLLNYAGTAVPLRVRNGCTVGRNAMLMNFYSAFGVDGVDGGAWTMYPGTFVQEGGYTWATNTTTYLVQGAMYLTNATVALGTVQVGMFNDTNSAGRIVQSGGFLSGKFDIRYGRFDLLAGELRGDLLVGNIGVGKVYQYGGTNFCSMNLGRSYYSGGEGEYYLYEGAVDCGQITAGTSEGASGYFYQRGGAVRVLALRLALYENICGGYSLENGNLQTKGFYTGGWFDQSGGSFVVQDPVYLAGSHNPRSGMTHAPSMSLSGGEMTFSGLELSDFATMTQSGGTNDINGELRVTGGNYLFGGHEDNEKYRMSGGVLKTFATSVVKLSDYGQPPTTFVQSGGTHLISGTLNITARYVLSAGTLVASNTLTSGEFVQTGGVQFLSRTLTNSGRYTLSGGTLTAPVISSRGELVISNSPAEPLLVNTDLFILGGHLRFYSAGQQFGRLVPVTWPCEITFGPEAGTLRFQDSSGMDWKYSSTMNVSNWNGSLNGNGVHQLMFGTSGNGLTPYQLTHIRFIAPAGLNGDYCARLLDTGEVVPGLPWPPRQFGYATNNGALTLVSYSGYGGVMTIPEAVNGMPVIGIGPRTFAGITFLDSIIVPGSVTNIGTEAFLNCSGLYAAYFQGNAPTIGTGAFQGAPATIYHLPGTTGWGTTFGGRPTAPWVLPQPVILSFGPQFGIQANQFGFVVSWATNVPVVIEASTDLTTGGWLPLVTNTLTDGSCYYSDPQWTQYQGRFYRVRGL